MQISPTQKALCLVLRLTWAIDDHCQNSQHHARHREATRALCGATNLWFPNSNDTPDYGLIDCAACIGELEAMVSGLRGMGIADPSPGKPTQEETVLGVGPEEFARIIYAWWASSPCRSPEEATSALAEEIRRHVVSHRGRDGLAPSMSAAFQLAMTDGRPIVLEFDGMVIRVGRKRT